MHQMSLSEVAVVMALASVVMIFLMLRFPNLIILLVVAVPAARMLIIEAFPALMQFTHMIEMFMIGLIWIGGLIKVAQGRVRLSPEKWWPYVLYLTMVLLAWAFLPFSRVDYGWKRAMSLVEMLLMFSAPLLCIATWKDIRTVSRCAILVGFCLSVAMFLFGRVVPEGDAERESVAYIDVLTIATNGGILAAMLTCAIMGVENRVIRISALLGIPAGLMTCYRSGSRGQLVAALVCMAVTVFFWRKIKPAVAMLLILVMVSLPLGFYLWGQTPASGRYSSGAISDSIAVRSAAVGISVSNFMKRIVIGYGPGDVGYQLKENGIPLDYSHFAVVDAFNELGVVGGAIYLTIFVMGFVNYIQAYRMATSLEVRGAIFASLMIVLFYTLELMKSGSYYSEPQATFFLGIGYVAPSIVRKLEEEQFDLAEQYAAQEMKAVEVA